MNKAIAVLILITIILSGSLFANESDTTPLVQRNNAYAIDLYHEIRKEEGNHFISPYSISSAFAMVYAGARENTADEIAEALNFSQGQKHLHTTFKTLNEQLIDNIQEGGNKFNLANGLFQPNNKPDLIVKEYKDFIQKYYAAEMFSGGLKEVNSWVADKTESKIKNILSALPKDLAAVILNAIYFKGNWASQFDENATQDAPFFTNATEEVSVPLMFQNSTFKFLQNDEFKVVSLPYEGDKVSMVIFLPNEVDGLEELEKSLNVRDLEYWLVNLEQRHPRELKLFLPKFELKKRYDLKRQSQNLGIKDAFDKSKANFMGMVLPLGEAWIDSIIHKSFVKVNEEGTEAAAVTAIMIGMVTSVRPPTPIFRADHPFLFLIKDNETGSILFMGRVTNPKS